MHRRDLVKGLALVLGSGLSPACQQALRVPLAERKVEQAIGTVEQREIAYRVVDLIIPQTDTPSAMQAGVGEFVDYVVTTWFSEAERQTFLHGIDALQAAALNGAGVRFLELDERQQVKLLSEAESRAQQPAMMDMFRDFGEGDFFASIKELAVVGYYTSEVGATIERSYVPMPGHYDGYYKFSEVGKQWSS